MNISKNEHGDIIAIEGQGWSLVCEDTIYQTTPSRYRLTVGDESIVLEGQGEYGYNGWIEVKESSVPATA